MTAAASRRVLLLVEDSEADAALVRDYLEDGGADLYEVHHAATMAEAMARLAALPVDVVLLDLRLPDSVATTGVGAIRERVGDVPILVLTGMNDEALAIDCINAGAQDYLFKNELQPRNLNRAIGYAITRQREAEVRELRDAIDRYRRLADHVDGVARKAGLGPMRLRSPEDFSDAIGRYVGLLQTFVITLRDEAGRPREAMLRLATRLGDFGAGPRDLIDVHTAALEQLAARLAARDQHTLVVEGRLFALEMMGMLVDYYRAGERRYLQ